MDELTGLHDLRAFTSLGEQMLEAASTANIRCQLFYAGVNGLTEVNDTFDRDTGWAMIVDAARLIRAVFRAPDLVARIGRDEFAVLAMLAPGMDSEVLPSRLRAAFDSAQVSLIRPSPLSLSIGIATFDPESRTSLKDLLAKAGSALHDEKGGKGTGRSNPTKRRFAAEPDAELVTICSLDADRQIRRGMDKHRGVSQAALRSLHDPRHFADGRSATRSRGDA